MEVEKADSVTAESFDMRLGPTIPVRLTTGTITAIAAVLHKVVEMSKSSLPSDMTRFIEAARDTFDDAVEEAIDREKAGADIQAESKRT